MGEAENNQLLWSQLNRLSQGNEACRRVVSMQERTLSSLGIENFKSIEIMRDVTSQEIDLLANLEKSEKREDTIKDRTALEVLKSVLTLVNNPLGVRESKKVLDHNEELLTELGY